MDKFEGVQYRLAGNWFSFVDVDKFENQHINYLETDGIHGANLLSVADSYGTHNDSKLYCFSKDSKYTNKFMNNIEKSDVRKKMIICHGSSNIEIPKFEDDFFDIVYVDGNHESECVLEDAVLSFRKLKKDGIMIFDVGESNALECGIDGFLFSYHKKITKLGEHNSQIFIKKN